MKAETPDSSPLVVADLRFRYGRRSPELFGGLSFSCAPGSLTIVEGENGCGKSTLLRLCAGIGRPTSGSIVVERRPAFLPQSTASLNPQLTGTEHVELFGAALGLSRGDARTRATALLERLHFVNSDLSTSVSKMSGGNRQKLNLALTLLDSSARLVLLDEPYAGFDTTSFTSFIELMRDLKGDGVAIIMVNHIADPRLPVDQDLALARPDTNGAAA